MAGLELVGWYDVQRMFGEYDPVTGERLSFGECLLAGGMLLVSLFFRLKGQELLPRQESKE
jgi:Pre-toxin TG